MKNAVLTSCKADQPVTWCHLAPIGSYPYIVRKDGKPILDAAGKPLVAVQVLDSAGLQRVVEAFDAATPCLLDREHRSLYSDDSTAMGWIERLEVRADGLWCLVRWTDVGRDQVENRRLRWLSPVWDTDADERPVALLSAGLTNGARFKDKLTPVINKADDGDLTTPGLAGTKDNENMKELAKLLGLSEDATEADILAAVKALQQFKTDAEAAKIATEAEAAYEGNKDAIANKADFVKAFIAAPAFGRAMVATLARKAVEVKDPVTNKGDARKPSFATDRDPVVNKLDEFQAMPEGPAKDSFQRDNADELLALQRKAAK